MKASLELRRAVKWGDITLIWVSPMDLWPFLNLGAFFRLLDIYNCFIFSPNTKRKRILGKQ